MKSTKGAALRLLAGLGVVLLLILCACANPAIAPATLAAEPRTDGLSIPTASSPEASATGMLRLSLKDFPLQDKIVTHVWVTITSVQVCGESAGWLTVFDSPAGTVYDLLELVEQPALLSTAQLPVDLYRQIRLVLGEDNRVVLGEEGEFPLRVPSGQQTGSKIGGEFEIREGCETSLLLDFDAQQSVKITGRSRYQMRPTVRIEEVSYAAADNRAPYPVTGPTTAPVFQNAAASTFQLDIAAPAGEADDPDGDRVYFRCGEVPAALAAVFSLDADTGLAAFAPGAPAGSYPMSFWSEAEPGASTIATPYVVSFTFLGGPVLYPRIVIDTYVPTGGGFAAADTFITLFGPEGDLTPGFDDAPPVSLAEDDNGNPVFANYARIDYTEGLMSGYYYVRVRGSDALQAGAYALRVVESVEAEMSVEAQYPAGWFFTATNPSDSPYEPDDDPPAGGVPVRPVELDLGGRLNRYLSAGEVDWVRVRLP